MKVLYIGGTGEISYACLRESVAAGQDCTVFNRARSGERLPGGVKQIVGDVGDAGSYSALAEQSFDVVCQFRAYTVAQIERDLEIFAGRTGQYVFISSASAYQKPPGKWMLTEDVPLRNPYWPYSQAKADMESRLMEAHRGGVLPVTIVRPSHTYRCRFPSTCVSGDETAWRMLNHRPIVCHGDGQSVWTLTHSSDFAAPFVKLLGKSVTLGQAYHVTGDQAYTWDEILQSIGRVLGVEPRIVHVSTDTLIRYNKEWTGPLMGDKAWSALFDLGKLKSVVGAFRCSVVLEEGLRGALGYVQERLASSGPKVELHALLDRIAEEQSELGT